MAFKLYYLDNELYDIWYTDDEPDPDEEIYATLQEAKREAMVYLKIKRTYLRQIEKKIRGCRSVEKMYEHRLFKTRCWQPVNFDASAEGVVVNCLELDEWLKQNTSSRWWLVAAIFEDPTRPLRFIYGKSFHFPCVEYRNGAKIFVFFSDNNDAAHYKLVHL